MREHPIPQDVVGYKFHIVGNMTLKQFAEIAVGVVIAVIIYNTNLIAFVKWPLIILSAGFGAMLAFMPIEERPLDHWVTTFFKRLYSPTKFYWKKESSVPFAFTHEKKEMSEEEKELEIDLTPARRQRIKEYIHSVGVEKDDDPLDDADQLRMQQILESYDDVEVRNIKATPQKIKPDLKPKVRNLARRRTISSTEMESVVFQQQKKSIQQHKDQQTQVENNLTTSPSLETPAVEVEPVEQKPFEVPQEEVSTSNELPFPKQPTTPNTLVGMVLTPDNKLIDQAVVQIKNNQGQPVQALKTNLLGQFSLSTALPNGTYVVSIEKEGFSFPEQTIALSGDIISPLEIRSSS